MLTEARYVARMMRCRQRLQRMPPAADPAALIRHNRLNREANFLDVLWRVVFGRPASPYARLSHWAGREDGDVRQMVAGEGLDAALARLYRAGARCCRHCGSNSRCAGCSECGGRPGTLEVLALKPFFLIQDPSKQD